MKIIKLTETTAANTLYCRADKILCIKHGNGGTSDIFIEGGLGINVKEKPSEIYDLVVSDDS